MTTLAECVAKGWNLHVHCHRQGCARLATLDTAKLLRDLGDMTIDKLKARLRCRACGDRPGDVRPRHDPPQKALRG